MRKAIRRLHRNDQGAAATEYIIILVLVAVGLLFAWQRFGQAIHDRLTDATDVVDSELTIPAE